MHSLGTPHMHSLGTPHMHSAAFVHFYLLILCTPLPQISLTLSRAPLPQISLTLSRAPLPQINLTLSRAPLPQMNLTLSRAPLPQINLTWALADHWEREMPGRIMTVHYEHLVSHGGWGDHHDCALRAPCESTGGDRLCISLTLPWIRQRGSQVNASSGGPLSRLCMLGLEWVVTDSILYSYIVTGGHTGS